MFVEDGDEEALDIDEGEVRDEHAVDLVDRFSFVGGREEVLEI
jgi:hypothetical protein